METLNAIMTRRSIRALKTDPIPKEKLDLLVQAGSQAASAETTAAKVKKASPRRSFICSILVMISLV